MNRIVVGVTGGMGSMAIGFGLLINASDKGDLSFMLSGAGLIIVGLIFWLDALKNAGKEDKISGQSRQALIGEVKGLRQDFKNEVKGLRQDLKNEVKGLRQDLKNEVKGLRQDLGNRDKGNGGN